MLKKHYSPYGEFIRQYRMNSGIYIKEMAARLGYMISYMKDLETGNEKLPSDFENILLGLFKFSESDKNTLHLAISKTLEEEKDEEAELKISLDEIEGIKTPQLVYELEDGAYEPFRAYPDDAGIDLASIDNVVLSSLSPTVVKTGLHVYIPRGYMGLICPRSGLTQKGIVAEIGVVDAGFTGEIQITMRLNYSYIKDNTNLRLKTAYIEKGDRVAQLVLVPIAYPVLVKGQIVEESLRGSNGYGSSGLKVQEISK